MSLLRIHAALDSKYRFNIVDELVDPLDVVSRAAKRLHSVNSVSQSYLDGQTMNINFVDCGLACLGEPQAFPTPVDATPDVKKYGANAILCNLSIFKSFLFEYLFEGTIFGEQIT
eukprot:UN24432